MHGGYTFSWMRVAELDINVGSSFSTEWTRVTVNSTQMCQLPSNTPGFYGTRFSIDGVKYPYTKVCGQARGYQKGMPGAFSVGRSIRNGYADGLSMYHNTRSRSK